MYLSHLFVAGVMVRYTPSLMTSDNFAYVCTTVVFSAALLWLVVLPVDRYRRRFGARDPVQQTNETRLAGDLEPRQVAG